MRRCSPDPRSERERAQATRSRDLGGRARRTKAPAAPTDFATSSREQPDGQRWRETATDQLTLLWRWRSRTYVRSRDQAQATRSRDLGGRARRTKAPAAPTDFATSSREQPDGQRWRETATDQLTLLWRWRSRTYVRSRDQAQATKSRDLGGRARRTKAPSAPTDTATSSREQPDRQRWRETATD